MHIPETYTDSLAHTKEEASDPPFLIKKCPKWVADLANTKRVRYSLRPSPFLLILSKGARFKLLLLDIFCKA